MSVEVMQSPETTNKPFEKRPQCCVTPKAYSQTDPSLRIARD